MTNEGGGILAVLPKGYGKSFISQVFLTDEVCSALM